MYEDWKENILPLMVSAPLEFSPDFFGVEQYFSARSLISSRSFEIDAYHGFGLVPLSDLFNHKTNAEDVHFTAVSSDIQSDGSPAYLNDVHPDPDNELKCWKSSLDEAGPDSFLVETNSGSDTDSVSSGIGDDRTMLEMVMVNNVKVGDEVFNTYGSLGNAALLHRYGFTEPDNPYDIVNLDLDLVLKWCSSVFSSRYSRARLSLWRKLDYCGCGDNCEYFEVSCDGEPQIELLMLLYIMLLPADAFTYFDLTISTSGNVGGPKDILLCENGKTIWIKDSEINRDLFLTKDVCKALVSIADIRESLYGSNSLEEDVEAARSCCVGKRKLYHSLMLRISERVILEKLRTYAATRDRLSAAARRSAMRKKLKHT